MEIGGVGSGSGHLHVENYPHFRSSLGLAKEGNGGSGATLLSSVRERMTNSIAPFLPAARKCPAWISISSTDRPIFANRDGRPVFLWSLSTTRDGPDFEFGVDSVRRFGRDDRSARARVTFLHEERI